MEGIRTWKLLASTLCALAAACSPALADPAADYAPGSPAAQTAADIAAAYWGQAPCSGQVEVAWSALDGDVNASSSWENPVGPYDDPAENSACRIVFNATSDWDWPKFCTVLVHEYGHLTGHPHSDDRSDVMYPYYQQPVGQCAPSAPAPRAAVAAVSAAKKPAGRPARRHRVRRHRRARG